MNVSAFSIPPQHVNGHGSAHSVITLEKPASLPPIEIVTYAVELLRLASCLLSTSLVFAPEHARRSM